MDTKYWDNKYKNQETPWDIGYASPAIIQYLTEINVDNKSILIPGAGNAYEAKWLLQHTIANVTVVDISPTVIEKLKIETNTYANRIKCELGNFFDHEGTYDLIIEQTFFCAIH
ncbi:MAG TPA: methyltransferase domain-containing protein, partial [Saprospiraceae bacterium]|nr:methyltransferase domain-containing protein [Saprospiraceae bacterium]